MVRAPHHKEPDPIVVVKKLNVPSCQDPTRLQVSSGSHLTETNSQRTFDFRPGSTKRVVT